ncbi:hypothetical protein VTI74DRAFT_2808 [Chaetomium olivicolor]
MSCTCRRFAGALLLWPSHTELPSAAHSKSALEGRTSSPGSARHRQLLLATGRTRQAWAPKSAACRHHDNLWSDVIRPVPTGTGGAPCGSVTVGQDGASLLSPTLHLLISSRHFCAARPLETSSRNVALARGEAPWGERFVSRGPVWSLPSKSRIQNPGRTNRRGVVAPADTELLIR